MQPNCLPATLAKQFWGSVHFSCIQRSHKATRQTLDSIKGSSRERGRESGRERGRERDGERQRGSSNAAAWRLVPFVHSAAVDWAETAFHITTIFYAQLSGFLCICAASVAAAIAITIAAAVAVAAVAAAAAYMKNYTKSQDLEQERAKCLPCT